MLRLVVGVAVVVGELAGDGERAGLLAVAGCVNGCQAGLDLDCLARLCLEVLRSRGVEVGEAGGRDLWREALVREGLREGHGRLGREWSGELRVRVWVWWWQRQRDSLVGGRGRGRIRVVRVWGVRVHRRRWRPL